jgi:hypothetical protein
MAVTLGSLAATGTAQAATHPSASATSHASATPSTSNVASLRAAVRSGTLGSVAGTYDVCAANHLTCNAQVKTVAPGSQTILTTSTPAGFGADDLAKAYGLTTAPAGAGTVAIIDAGAYPKLESDLAIYRAMYHLPACTTASGCLTIENYTGGKAYAPQTSTKGKALEQQLAVEASLDMDMASAACPRCKLIELQVPWDDAMVAPAAREHVSESHFATGVVTAHRLGADAVSISYGYTSDAYSDKGSPATRMAIAGLAVTASSGDSGYEADAGQWPQDLPTVISVGGTSLHESAKGTFSESAWDDAGSSCAADLPAAQGQPASVTVNCHGKRTSTDISADANPNTGPATYDSYAPANGKPVGWHVIGGTSASSPFIAAMYARAGVPASVRGPKAIYAAPSSAFRDPTSGESAPASFCQLDDIGAPVCVARVGWDGPTGRGSPKGLAPFA